MNRSLLIAALAACFGWAGAVRGDINYTYVAEPQSGSISFGASNVINLYLDETLTAGSTSVIQADYGLYSAGVAFVERPGGTGVTVTAVTANTQPEPKGFANNDITRIDTSGVGASMFDITAHDAVAGVFPTSTSTVGSTTTNLYLLGNVTLNISASASAAFDVESLHDAPTNVGVYDAGMNGVTLDFNGADMDIGGPGIGTGANGHATTFAVPEPAATALFGLGALGLVLRRRGRI